MPTIETPDKAASPMQDTTSESFDSKLISSGPGTKIVAIDVSDDVNSKTYWLHSDVLCKASPVFGSAFNGSRWTEGKASRMTWPECDPKAFDVFVHWLYTKRLPWDEDYLVREDTELWLFFEVLDLGDRALIPSLKADACERIWDLIGSNSEYPSSAFVREIYDRDLDDTQLRELPGLTARHVAWFVCKGEIKEDRVKSILEETPLFAVDLAKAFSDFGALHDPTRIEWYNKLHALAVSNIAP